MTSLVLSTAVAATMFASTVFSPSPTPTQIPLTRALPENNFVSYPVQAGDTLDSIAHDYYGDTSFWTDLWDDNPWVKDPDKLDSGVSLKLHLLKPEKAEALAKELKDRFDQLHTVVPEVQAVSVRMDDNAYPQSSFEDVYKQAGAAYGVPWQVLYGIHMTETGLRNGAIFNHAGSGAQGPMQFMPGTFRAYAVEGHTDINNAVDAIYAAANFMAKHGSLMAGLRSYGGNISGVLAAAKAKGYGD